MAEQNIDKDLVRANTIEKNIYKCIKSSQELAKTQHSLETACSNFLMFTASYIHNAQ